MNDKGKEAVDSVGAFVQRWADLRTRTLQIPLIQWQNVVDVPSIASIASELFPSVASYAAKQILESVRMSSSMQSALAALHELSTSPMLDIAATLKASTEISSAFAAVDTHSLNTLQEQVRSITAGFDWVPQWAAVAASVANAAQQAMQQADVFRPLQEYIKEQDDAVDAFRAAGWPIAPSMPRELIQHVIGLHQAGKTRYATQVILGYYRRSDNEVLTAAVDRWQACNHFKSRMHIFRDALSVHRSGTYTLSVPALIMQVEGVLSEYVVANHLTAKLGKISDVYEAVIGDPEKGPFQVWAISETLLCQLSTNTYSYTDFGQQLALPVRKRRTTRHTIAHGIMPGYDRESVSLKAFLLLDAISALRQFRPEDEGNS